MVGDALGYPSLAWNQGIEDEAQLPPGSLWGSPRDTWTDSDANVDASLELKYNNRIIYIQYIYIYVYIYMYIYILYVYIYCIYVYILYVYIYICDIYIIWRKMIQDIRQYTIEEPWISDQQKSPEKNATVKSWRNRRGPWCIAMSKKTYQLS
jgi:hypothetical protein